MTLVLLDCLIPNRFPKNKIGALVILCIVKPDLTLVDLFFRLTPSGHLNVWLLPDQHVLVCGGVQGLRRL